MGMVKKVLVVKEMMEFLTLECALSYIRQTNITSAKQRKATGEHGLSPGPNSWKKMYFNYAQLWEISCDQIGDDYQEKEGFYVVTFNLSSKKCSGFIN